MRHTYTVTAITHEDGNVWEHTFKVAEAASREDAIKQVEDTHCTWSRWINADTLWRVRQGCEAPDVFCVDITMNGKVK